MTTRFKDERPTGPARATSDERALRDMARLGFDAAKTVHDLSNIVGAAAGYAQLAAMGGTPEEMKESLDVAIPALGRARDALTRFKNAANTIRPPAPVPVAELVDWAAGIFRKEWSETGWRLETDGDLEARVLIPAEEMVLVLRCLLLHHMEAGEGTGALRVEARRLDSRVALTIGGPVPVRQAAFRFRDWVFQRTLAAGVQFVENVDEEGRTLFRLTLPAL